MQIDAWLRERRWSIRGTGAFDDMALIDGRTDDLDQVAVAARAWHDGASLSDISQTTTQRSGWAEGSRLRTSASSLPPARLWHGPYASCHVAR
ncbi:hypothetical protein [Streptomyces anulatus]|uniref:hypothetical protein n=1 Tax=Streptomyces anulatus TaxID=1892 RepID=UPI00364BAA97